MILLWPKEQSVIEKITSQVALPLDFNLLTWNLADGLKQVKYSQLDGISYEDVEDYTSPTDPILDTLSYIEEYLDKAIFVMTDLQYYLGSDPHRTDYAVIRKVKNLCFTLKRSYKRLILLGQGMTLSSEFEGLIHALANDLPDPERIKTVIKESFTDLMANGFSVDLELDSPQGEKLIRSAQGLTIEEIRDAIRLAAVIDHGINHHCYQRVNDLKINKLRQLNVEFTAPPEVAVGGLELLKQWLHQRAKLFSAQLQKAQLPSPKGIMLVGIPGTGKSLVAKTIGQMWTIPILKLDLGTIYNSLVGESEKNMRQLLKTAEAVAPCVLWIDEIEKGLAGSSGANDSGVAQRIFGQFLTWMSEHQAPVFVVATANELSGLPPELTRKGRFDEVFFLDLPHQSERIEILSLHLQRHEVILTEQELEQLAQLAENFSGAELAGIVDDAAISCFHDERYPQISPQDLTEAITATRPLAIREKERIAALKAWAKSSARLASAPVTTTKKTVKSKGSKQVQML